MVEFAMKGGDNSVGGTTDYPSSYADKDKQAVDDPKKGVANNLDQGDPGTSMWYALAACLYE